MTLRLNGSTSGYTEIDAPAVAGNNLLVLPTGNGVAGQVLSTNGSGAMSWVGGRVIQVAQAFKSDTFTTTSTSFVDVTGLSVSITPASSSNKVLVLFFVNCGTSAATYSSIFRITRNGTAIGIADAAGSRPQATTRYQGSDVNHGYNVSGCYVDSPVTTASVTYKIQMQVQVGGITATINRTGTDTDGTDAYQARSTSNIIVMEVAA